MAGVDRVGNKLVCLRRLDEVCIKGGSVVHAELDFVNKQMSVIHWGFEVRLTDWKTRKRGIVGVAGWKGGWYPEAAKTRRSGWGEIVKVGEIRSNRR